MAETLLDKKIYPTAEFVPGKWQSEINVRDFMQHNYISGRSIFS